MRLRRPPCKGKRLARQVACVTFGSGQHLGWLLAFTFLAACAAPSRRLPPRLVDEPMSLPDNMAAVEVDTFASRQQVRPQTRKDAAFSYSYGLTDRLELVDLLSLRYTLFDDSPTTLAMGRKQDPFSLAIRAGIKALGSSSVEGGFVNPVLVLHVRKRIGTEAYGFSRASYFGHESVSRRRSATLSLSVGIIRQVSQRSVVELSVTAARRYDCTRQDCGRNSRTLSISPGWSARVYHWWTIGISIDAWIGDSWWPPYSMAPDAMLYPTSRSNRGLGGTFSNTFFW